MNGTEAEIAWAAGVFEGEGHITNRPYKDRKGTQRVLRLRMTDKDVVDRFQRIVDCGQRYGPFKDDCKRNKPIHDWQCTKWSEIERVLNAFLPWLGERRREAAVALLANPGRPPGGRKQDVCGRGHSLRDGDPNVYVSPGGVRHCRACKSVVYKRYHERRKAQA